MPATVPREPVPAAQISLRPTEEAPGRSHGWRTCRALFQTVFRAEVEPVSCRSDGRTGRPWRGHAGRCSGKQASALTSNHQPCKTDRKRAGKASRRGAEDWRCSVLLVGPQPGAATSRRSTSTHQRRLSPMRKMWEMPLARSARSVSGAMPARTDGVSARSSGAKSHCSDWRCAAAAEPSADAAAAEASMARRGRGRPSSHASGGGQRLSTSDAGRGHQRERRRRRAGSGAGVWTWRRRRRRGERARRQRPPSSLCGTARRHLARVPAAPAAAATAHGALGDPSCPAFLLTSILRKSPRYTTHALLAQSLRTSSSCTCLTACVLRAHFHSATPQRSSRASRLRCVPTSPPLLPQSPTSCSCPVKSRSAALSSARSAAAAFSLAWAALAADTPRPHPPRQRRWARIALAHSPTAKRAA